ncbi:hypothetical protein OEA41_000335 [Lepraria neglecta]|uniref:Aminoacyl-tRNA synthetase class II (D/K/N) domain-containing protein n=1 Tax=Lepraria neglecta TaxID=209136 RepID=A0AAD9ZIE0_9LECA|nr:hypothetical protein OEA41_000335 [Lepraria neglecta]
MPKRLIGRTNRSRGAQEVQLGAIIKSKYGTDLFLIKDFPSDLRPFYTKWSERSHLTKSMDFTLRGQEIVSGSGKADSYKRVLEAMALKGIEPDEYRAYTEHYKTGGVPPHGGIGTGLKRIVQSYLSLTSVFGT